MLQKEVIQRLLLKEVNKISSLQQQLQRIEQQIKKQVNDCLRKELAKHVKEEIQTAVSTEIYNSGIPEIYNRRGGNDYGGMGAVNGSGSLGDVQQMNHSVLNMTLKVTDDAKRNDDYDYAGYGYDLGKSLLENMQMGYGNKIFWWNKPRPILSVAKQHMRETGVHVEVMKDALQKRFGRKNVF